MEMWTMEKPMSAGRLCALALTASIALPIAVGAVNALQIQNLAG